MSLQKVSHIFMRYRTHVKLCPYSGCIQFMFDFTVKVFSSNRFADEPILYPFTGSFVAYHVVKGVLLRRKTWHLPNWLKISAI